MQLTVNIFIIQSTTIIMSCDHILAWNCPCTRLDGRPASQFENRKYVVPGCGRPEGGKGSSGYTILSTNSRVWTHNYHHQISMLSVYILWHDRSIRLLWCSYRRGWSRFSRNVHFIIAHHRQCIVFADSAG